MYVKSCTYKYKLVVCTRTVLIIVMVLIVPLLASKVLKMIL
jgi:hypothetical protein